MLWRLLMESELSSSLYLVLVLKSAVNLLGQLLLTLNPLFLSPEQPFVVFYSSSLFSLGCCIMGLYVFFGEFLCWAFAARLLGLPSHGLS